VSGIAQARQPNFARSATDSAGQRLLFQLGELVRTLIAQRVFLQRPTLANIIVPAAGRQSALVWGDLNRLLLTADFDVQLPRIKPEWVGVPLEVILLDTGSNAATFVPTGAGLQTPSRPLINGAASLTKNAAGLYVLKTDGQNWFTNSGP